MLFWEESGLIFRKMKEEIATFLREKRWEMSGPVLKSPSVQLNSRSKFSSIQLVGARIEAELSWTFKKDGANLLWAL